MPDENSSKSTTKTALTTRASRGLGRNTALGLAKRGVDVILTYHSNRAEADQRQRLTISPSQRISSSGFGSFASSSSLNCASM
jgi:NAD(P)-dependent dehydrogenase (short-subunit alcohol dehydrogenase family)